MKGTLNLLLAGFGGQGILFAGKMAAYAGLLDEHEISWLPSYGPEMRGGTANCSVCISDKPIGSPMVLNPDILLVMNLPSLDRFIDSVQPGGVVIVDSTIIKKRVTREDITVHYVPATEMAEEKGLKGMANIILLGKLYQETAFCSPEALEGAVSKCVPEKKASMRAANRTALRLGMETK